MNIVSIGEILWDVFPAGERLGGAPFNFSAHAARLGHSVAFLSGVGRDALGDRALAQMSSLGVSPAWMTKVTDAPTGSVTVELDRGEPRYTIHRPAAYDFPALDDAHLDAVSRLPPHCIYYGTLAQTSPAVRLLTQRVFEACPNVPRFYDVNLRPGSDDPALVSGLIASAQIVKLNREEAHRLAPTWSLPASPVEAFCRAVTDRFSLIGVCVTLGAEGCAIFYRGEFVACPGVRVSVQDAVGAGDAFSAALVHGLFQGLPLAETGALANRVGALVASRAGAIPDWSLAEALSL